MYKYTLNYDSPYNRKSTESNQWRQMADPWNSCRKFSGGFVGINVDKVNICLNEASE